LHGIVGFFIVLARLALNFLTINIFVIKALSFVLCCILLVGFIYASKKSTDELRKLRNIRTRDYLGLGKKEEARSIRAWEVINNRLASRREDQVRLALKETDDLFSDLLVKMGFVGKTFEERFVWLHPDKVSNFEKLEAAHRDLQAILHGTTPLTMEAAVE